jgi:asparagine synthase (glutamine-hydrolysing)
MSMAHGLEVRTPFLDPDLADFALRLPASLKISPGGTTKAVLRHLAGRTYGVDLAGARKQDSRSPFTPGCAARRGRSPRSCCRGHRWPTWPASIRARSAP